MNEVSEDRVRVGREEVGAILALRTRVLRPHFPPGELARFDGDEDRHTLHYALREEGEEEVLGCLSLMVRGHALLFGDQAAVQLRGMAVAPERQGEGLGGRLIEVALQDAALFYSPITRVWCNARVRAVGVYERAGFERFGEEFEIEGIGPHVVMWRALPLLMAA